MRGKIVLIVFLSLLALACGTFYYLVQKNIITPFAQSSEPSISLSPASATKTIGSTFSVYIMADSAGQEISVIDVSYLHYDKNKLQVLDSDTTRSGIQIKRGTIFPATNYLSDSVEVDPSAGTINLSGYFNPGIGNQEAVSGTFAIISFKAIATGEARLYFDFDPANPSTVDTNMVRDTGGGNLVDVLRVANGATYTIKQPVPTVDLKVDGKDGSVNKNQGESAALSWSSKNATSCTASGGWSGTKDTQGNQTITDLSKSAAYTLSCAGDGGMAKDTVTINVVTGSNPPTVDIKANDNDGPIEVEVGKSITLSWNSARADTCIASGDWSGEKATSGNEAVEGLDASKTFILSCRNSDGEVIDSVSVNTVPAQGTSEETSQPTDEATSDETVSEQTDEQVSDLPDTLKPATNPTKKTTTSLYKNQTLKPWALWFLYAIIPAFLAGIAIYLFLIRRKKAKKENNTLV